MQELLVITEASLWRGFTACMVRENGEKGRGKRVVTYERYR